MNTSFARALICSFTIAGAVLLSEAARSQAIFRTEVHPVQTFTLSTADFLLGKKDGKPVTIAGELRIPKPGTDRLPAVVLVHGAGGVGFNVGMWAGELNKAGFATFVADSFTGRGITNTIFDQAQLSAFHDDKRHLCCARRAREASAHRSGKDCGRGFLEGRRTRALRKHDPFPERLRARGRELRRLYRFLHALQHRDD